MESSNYDDFEESQEYICPLTLELMADPVVTPDGHSYERKAIENWLEKNNTSPMTGLKFTEKVNLYSNIRLKNTIQEFKIKSQRKLQLKQDFELGNKLQIESSTKSGDLKEKANLLFSSQDFQGALDLYSQALEDNDISLKERAVILSNRSAANLEIYLKNNKPSYLEDAARDAKRCLSDDPSFIKGYYRLARVYHLKQKLEKAIIYYQKVLLHLPNNEEIKTFLALANSEYERQKRYEYLNPLNMPEDFDEILENEVEKGKKLGINISKEKIYDLMTKDKDDAEFLKAQEYRFGTKNIRKDQIKAISIFSKLAQKNSAQAMYCLALMLIKGEGIDADFPKAINLLEKTAELPATRQKGIPNPGVMEAQHQLGLMYEEGTYVSQNFNIAKKWYEKAIENGNPMSANNLGCFYMNGKIETNLDLAEKYFLFAINKQNDHTIINLVDVYISKGLPDKALLWHKKAIEKKCLYSISRDKEILSTIEKLNKILDEGDVSKWEKENNLNIENLSISQRVERKLKSKAKPNEIILFNKIKENLEKLKKSPKLGKNIKLKDFLKKYNIEKLKISSENGSIEASNILNIILKTIDLWELLEQYNSSPLNLDNKIITLFSDIIKLDHSLCLIETNQAELLKKIFQNNILTNDEKSELDENARLCQIFITMPQLKAAKKLGEFHLSKYKENFYMLFFLSGVNAFLKDYKSSLNLLNEALEINSKFSEAIFSKASCLRSLERFKESIDCYELFLDNCHRDCKKYPEAYYGIATCHFYSSSEKLAMQYFNKGKEAENYQLSCNMPYDSNLKLFLETFNSIGNFDKKTQNDIPVKNELQKVSCKNVLIGPLRKEIVLEFRKKYEEIRESHEELKKGEVAGFLSVSANKILN